MIEGVGSWARLQPATFLTDHYLKYIAWALSDKVRCGVCVGGGVRGRVERCCVASYGAKLGGRGEGWTDDRVCHTHLPPPSALTHHPLHPQPPTPPPCPPLQDPRVRLASVNALLALYSDADNKASLQDFTERFRQRFAELFYDVDEAVAVKGVRWA